MPAENEFVVHITDRDRIRVKITVERGVPERVVVQLECEVDGQWYEARRYDNHHGYVHLHVRPWDTLNDRTIPSSVGDLRHSIGTLIADLQASWLQARAMLAADVGAQHDDA